VVAGDPSASLLYRKVFATQAADEGAVMPLGVSPASAPIGDALVLEEWINQGASLDCSDSPDEQQGWDPGPNALDQDALFTCADPTLSSPARFRRIERREWTHAVGKPLVPTWYGSVARNNPFDAPGHHPYTTYSDDVTVDAATLDLYFAVIEEGTSGWNDRSGYGAGAVRTYIPYNDTSIRCIYQDAAPDEACVDAYVDTYLSRGAYFRAPTDGERQRFKDHLTALLDAEADPADRPDTMRQANSAVWLTSGALFKRELGDADAEVDGRRPLKNDELARAIGAVLSTHPAGSSAMFDFGGGPPEHPNWTAPDDGYLGQIWAAAEDGSIQAPATIEALMDLYAGGIDAGRWDLQLEFNPEEQLARGEYWLAPRIADFFREWLDYEGAAIIFKDTVRATTQWDGDYTGDPMWDPMTLAWGNLQSSANGNESTLIQQLDDTIARVVMEDTNVFENLMTTTQWHVASNVAQTNGVSCSDDAECVESGYTQCSIIGLCANNIHRSTVLVHYPYNLTSDVPETPAGRWVQMPPGERAGVLTHPAWLAAHGGNFEDDASLVHRGKWIRENLFCEVVPPLELVQVEAKLVPSAPDLSARERVIESTVNNPDAATCMGCHNKMNTLGFPFEVYNHAGYYRATDHGSAPDGSATIDNAPDPLLNTTVNHAVDLADLLSQSDHTKRCFVRQTFRYFMGRDETLADACVLSEMETSLNDSGGSFLTMLKALVTSDAFLYRHDEPDAPPGDNNAGVSP
jgi:hypothetical protein